MVKIRFLICFSLITGAFSATAQTSYGLQKALQTAKANSPVLKAEQFEASIAEADIVTARLRPNLVLNNQTLHSAQPSSFPVNTTWSNAHNRQVWWQLTKSFQLAGQRKYKIDFAEQNAAFSKKVYSEDERNLLETVALKWLDTWNARKQLELLQVAKNNIDSLTAVNQLRYKNQVITETELIRTKMLANQYSLQLKSAQQEYNNEIASLQFLLGVQEKISIDTSDQFLFALPSDLDSLLQLALHERSDIRALESAIDLAGSNMKLQKALAWPQPELGVIYNPQNSIPYVGIYGTIELPVFSRNQGEIKKSVLVRQQAEQRLQTTQTQIQTELTTAYNTYQTQKTNLANFDDLLTQSENILTSVKYAYLRGGTTIIDFLEAQRSWLETQQQYYETLQQYKQSYIQLLYVSGLISQIAQ